MNTTTPAPAAWSARSHLTALALGLGTFLTQFDVTAVIMALPLISRELEFGVAGFAWVIDAYSLAFTAALLLAGATADRFGRRRVMLFGNALFMLASIACGVAWNGPSIWAARAMQGVGAAFLVTGALALVANAFPHGAHRARAFGWMGVVSGVAMALGPTLGGLIASVCGWRWLFLANVPLCLGLAAVVPRLVDEVREREGKPIDPAGIALLTAALALGIDAMLRARESIALCATGLAAACALTALFGWQQRRQAHPLVDPRVFATPVIGGLGALLFAMSVGYWAVLVYLPLFLGMGLGWNATMVGPGLLVATLPMLVLPPIVGRLLPRWGWRRLFALALGAVAAGDLLLLVSALSSNTDTQFACVTAGMAAIGIGAALGHPQLSGAMLALAPPERAGMASALTVVARQAGFAVGVAALGAALGLAQAAERFAMPFALAMVVALCGMVAALLLLPRAGVGAGTA